MSTENVLPFPTFQRRLPTEILTEIADVAKRAMEFADAEDTAMRTITATLLMRLAEELAGAHPKPKKEQPNE